MLHCVPGWVLPDVSNELPPSFLMVKWTKVGEVISCSCPYRRLVPAGVFGVCKRGQGSDDIFAWICIVQGEVAFERKYHVSTCVSGAWSISIYSSSKYWYGHWWSPARRGHLSPGLNCYFVICPCFSRYTLDKKSRLEFGTDRVTQHSYCCFPCFHVVDTSREHF
jgi:hypothetical protein